MMWYSRTDEQLTLEIKVFPRSPHTRIGPVEGDRLQVRIHAVPEDGAANAAVVSLLARAFDVPLRSVTIVVGQTSRQKSVRITGSRVDPVTFEKDAVDVKSK